MPRPLPEGLVAPGHTVLVTQECQNGVIGAQTGMPDLAEEARREAIPNIARLCAAARGAGVPVVHCIIHHRSDHLGMNRNARLFERAASAPGGLIVNSVAAEVLPELEVAETDFVFPRWRGLGPMGGSELDVVLRNMGVTTIVGVGVSVNVAMTNFAMDAVNYGYRFVLPRDAVAGIPHDYAEAVIRNTLSLLTTLTTTDDMVDAWS
jgi:nicotinamidase-related amidase